MAVKRYTIISFCTFVLRKSAGNYLAVRDFQEDRERALFDPMYKMTTHRPAVSLLLLLLDSTGREHH